MLGILTLAALQSAASPAPPSSYLHYYGTGGPWVIHTRDLGCSAHQERPAANDPDLTFVSNARHRQLGLLIWIAGRNEPFDRSRTDYRLVFGASGSSGPPPPMAVQIGSWAVDGGVTLALNFDEAAMPSLLDAFSRSTRFEVRSGGRPVVASNLNGVADGLRVFADCVANFRLDPRLRLPR